MKRVSEARDRSDDVWFEILPNLSIITLSIPINLQNFDGLEVKRDCISLRCKERNFLSYPFPVNVDPRSVRITGSGDGIDVKLTINQKLDSLQNSLTDTANFFSAENNNFSKLKEINPVGFRAGSGRKTNPLLNSDLLLNTKTIKCNFCKKDLYLRTIKDGGDIKDNSFSRCASLPSEYWSELAEYWTCHNEDLTKLPGLYNGNILSQKGVIMYNRAHLLLHSDDLSMDAFRDLELSNDLKNAQKLQCSICGHILGTYINNPLSEGISNYPAYSIKLYIVWIEIVIDNYGEDKLIDKCFPSIFVYDAIDLCETHAFYRLIANATCGNSHLQIFLWIVGMDVLCGRLCAIIPNDKSRNNDVSNYSRSVKVLYSHTMQYDNIPPKVSSAQKSWLSDKDIEKIYFEFSLLEELLAYLNLSNKILPPHKSITKYWKVGLLQYG